MNDFDKEQINERLDLAIKVVEGYNHDISSIVGGDLYAYISDELADGVDIASVEYYLKPRYQDNENTLLDLQDRYNEAVDNDDFDEKIDLSELIKGMELLEDDDVMVDITKLDPLHPYNIKAVTTHDIIEYLKSRKY